MAAKRKTKRRSDHAEYRAVFEAAHARVGFSDDQKLKWLFEFLETDLSRLSDKEEKIFGESVRALSDEYQTTEGYSSFLVGDKLADYQSTITLGLKGLFQDNIRGWTISPPKEVYLWRMSPITSRGAHFQFILRGDERGGILYGVMDLLRRSPGRVRACGFCHKPILRIKRQEYCNEECSRAQREKNRQQQREKSRLLNLLTKLNVISQLPDGASQAKDLRQKLTGTKNVDDFWKDVSNGTEAVLKRWLSMKGRRPKDFR